MSERFQANGLPLLIGSLPMRNHEKALDLVMDYTPEIPLWVQLPVHPEEGMIYQFMPGLPGFTVEGGKAFMDLGSPDYENQLLAFYEEYMAVTEGGADLDESRFVLTPDTAQGFFIFMDRLGKTEQKPQAVKAQITGPITFATAVKDREGRAIFYDDQARDAAVKLLALKAQWQVRQLKKVGVPVILFFDEPALAGYGSSEFISISREAIAQCFEEVFAAAHAEGALVGVHVCSNTDWSLILDSTAEIVSFDAYSFFDKFLLFSQQVKDFIQKGKHIAWGIVPTSETEDIDQETPESLAQKWEAQAKQMEDLGLSRSEVLAQTFITPSCGTGSMDLDHATRVLHLTRAVSDKLR